MRHRFRNRVVPVFWETLRRWNQDDGLLLSAAMAYYGAFSLFPLCLVLISAMGYLARVMPQLHIGKTELIERVGQNASPWVADKLNQLLAGVETKAGVGGLIGWITLTIGAIALFAQLDAIFSRIWGLPGDPKQSWLRWIRKALVDRLIAFLMLLVLGSLLILLFLGNLALAGVRTYTLSVPGGDILWGYGQTTFTLVSNTILFTILYKFLPRAKVRLVHALIGGVFVAIIWDFGQRLLSWLIIGEKYSAYGVVGAFVALMIWMYYASAVVFLGAELVRSLQEPPSNEGESI